MMEMTELFGSFPLQNPRFVGRERLLCDLEETLTKNRRAVLVGRDGIGKTQTARAYALLPREKPYHYVFWARADTYAHLLADLGQIAVDLRLPEKSATDLRVAAVAVRSWLERKRDWL
jgi:hypothetical protein